LSQERIAFATKRPGGLNAKIADRFGRAETFTIIDIDISTGSVLSVKVIENPAINEARGAGVKAVQKLAEEGVTIAVGPTPGPHALMALRASGIKFYEARGESVIEALRNLLAKISKKS